METDTLLREAIRADDWPRLRAILQEHGLDVNIRYCKDERTPLTVAVWLGSGRIVRHLIDAGADVNTGMEYDRMTPLHWACRYGRAEIARALVTASANFRAINELSETPLHFASLNGSVEKVRLLLDAGADALSKTVNGKLPLHYACFAKVGHLEVVKELVERCEEEHTIIFAKDLSFQTPLDAARDVRYHAEYTTVVDYLLECYQKIALEQEGPLCLHKILREAVYSVKARGSRRTSDGSADECSDGTVSGDEGCDGTANGDGESLVVAVNDDGSDDGGIEIVLPIGKLTLAHMLRLLKSLAAHVPTQLQNENGDTALHVACETRAPKEVVRLLVEHDPASLRVANRAGALPLHVVASLCGPCSQHRPGSSAGDPRPYYHDDRLTNDSDRGLPTEPKE